MHVHIARTRGGTGMKPIYVDDYINQPSGACRWGVGGGGGVWLCLWNPPDLKRDILYHLGGGCPPPY